MKNYFTLIFLLLLLPKIHAQEEEKHYQKGTDYFAIFQLEKALSEFELAKKTNPNFAKAYEGIGTVFLKKQELTLAKINFIKALELDKNSINALLGLAQISNFEKQNENALEFLEKAEKLDNTKVSTYLLLGRVYFDLQKFHESYKNYGKVLELSPQNFEAKIKLKNLENYKNEPEKNHSNLNIFWNKLETKQEVTRLDFAIALASNFDFSKMISSKYRKQKIYGDSLATDVSPENPAKNYVRAVLEFKILELDPEGKFGTETFLTKGELALALQNFLVEIFDEPSLASQYLNGGQVFPDVPTTHFCYNPVVLVTSRNILPANFDGTFGVNSFVSGKLLKQTIENLKVKSEK
ncbi:S-layer homology domain-containing protein [bacterium]|nr:S-layer homology domain-containing protein [bacterium]